MLVEVEQLHEVLTTDNGLLLVGFLSREGTRLGEAVLLTWGDLDLDRGVVRLDKNKTNDPRAWALSAGVVAALRVYRDRYRPNAKCGRAPQGDLTRSGRRLCFPRVRLRPRLAGALLG